MPGENAHDKGRRYLTEGRWSQSASTAPAPLRCAQGKNAPILRRELHLVDDPGDAEPEEGKADQGQSNQPSRPGGFGVALFGWTRSKQDEARNGCERRRHSEYPLQFQPGHPPRRFRA